MALKFYRIYFTTYHNNTEISQETQRTLCEEEDAKNYTCEINWNNLDEMYSTLGIGCSFNYLNTKKGRWVSFFSDCFFPVGDYADVKEWKHPDLNISVKIEFKDITDHISIQDVLDWPDAKMAIQFLKENGLDKPINL